MVIGGGLGTAIAYPTAKALKEAGNYVISIIGARTRELVILESEVRAISDETHVMTDDGSYLEQGFVTDKLKSLRNFQTQDADPGHPAAECKLAISRGSLPITSGRRVSSDCPPTLRPRANGWLLSAVAPPPWLIYRRSEKEMPARLEEIKHTKEEGVQLMMLTNPVEFLGDDKGRLTGAKLQKMELGEPDSSGRRRPVPIAGSEFFLPLQVAVITAGNRGNPLVQSTTPIWPRTKGVTL